MTSRSCKCTILAFATVLGAWSQNNTSSTGTQPIYKVTVVSRTLPAVNYEHLAGPTLIDFQGTVLLPKAKGVATVESKRGRVAIEAKFDHLEAPTRYGREYLTYVLWAITPEGRARNLGEIVPGPSDKARISVTTDLQALGLMVTAEPYYSVTAPSDVVVLENAIRPDTVGRIEPVMAKYELLPRGEFNMTMNPAPAPAGAEQQKLSFDRYEAVLEIYQAQNAIQIAQSAGAGRFAADTLGKAQALLSEAQNLQLRKQDVGLIVSRAREAAQMAEDARVIAIRNTEQQRMTTVQSQRSEDKIALRKAQEQALQAQADANAAREQAERARAAAENAQAQAELERSKLQAVQRPAPPPPLVGEPVPAPINLTGTQRQARATLLEKLNGLLPTMDTPRGLVIIVPNSSFETSGTLRSAFSERLALIATTLASRRDLTVNVKGYTDDRGSEAQRQRLSQERAQQVRMVLAANGLPTNSIQAVGLGSDRPLASNATTGGREQNRRVEIVIAGPSIGSIALWDRTYNLSSRQ